MVKLRFMTCVVLLLAVCFAGQAQAQDNARIKKLEDTLAQLQAELAAIKAERVPAGAVSQEKIDAMVSKAMEAEKANIPEWTQNIFNFNGDLRIRHEIEDDSSTSDDDSKTSVRGRVTIYGSVNKETDLILRVSSGNETMTGEFADKSVEMEQMYVDYHPTSMEKFPFLGVGVDFLENVSPWYLPGQKGTHILAGKIPHPFYHPFDSSLVFDGPNPEGVAATVKGPFTDNENLSGFATAGIFSITDRAVDDTHVTGIQVGGTIQKPINGMENEIPYATVAVGYFDFGNIEGQSGTITSNSETTPGSGIYTNDYGLLTIGGEFGCPLGGIPIVGYAEYVKNLDARNSNMDTGYLVGASIGEIADVGDWDVIYNYRDVEKDAAVDAFNAGFGQGTDTKGHTIGINYKVADNVVFTGSWYTGQKEISTGEEDYDLIELDMVFKF